MTEVITVPVDGHSNSSGAMLIKVFSRYGFTAVIAPSFVIYLGLICNAHCRWNPSGLLYGF